MQETVRKFMKNEVCRQEDKLPHDAYEMPADMLEPLRDKARAMGLWAFRTPEEFGGAGLNLLGQAIVAEEVAKCRMGAYVPACGAFGSDPPNAVQLGTQHQIDKYLKPAVQKGKKCFVAISEPSGGSDPARAIRTARKSAAIATYSTGRRCGLLAPPARTGGWCSPVPVPAATAPAFHASSSMVIPRG